MRRVEEIEDERRRSDHVEEFEGRSRRSKSKVETSRGTAGATNPVALRPSTFDNFDLRQLRPAKRKRSSSTVFVPFDPSSSRIPERSLRPLERQPHRFSALLIDPHPRRIILQLRQEL